MAPPYDFLTNLPDKVKDKILTDLPIVDAVRTSILSTQWRYRWRKLRHLIIDHTLWNVYHPDNVGDDIIFTNALYQILMLHEGPIIQFDLNLSFTKSSPELHNALFFLSRNGIEHLSLKMSTMMGQNKTKLTSSLFACRELKHLCLHDCWIGDRLSFEGFSRLIYLELADVDVSNEMIARLISSSPLLESLIMQLWRPDFIFEIEAPYLRNFAFDGSAQSIVFRSTPKIEFIYVALFPKGDIDDIPGTYDWNAIFFSHALPHLREMDIRVYGLSQLLVDRFGSLKSISTNLFNLQDLSIYYVSLYSPEMLSFLLAVMRTSPNLQRVRISHGTELVGSRVSGPTKILKILKKEDQSCIPLNCKEVTFTTFKWGTVEKAFVKLLLNNSPGLEKILLFEKFSLSDAEKYDDYRKELLEYTCASKKARVIFK